MCAADKLAPTIQAGPWQRDFQLQRAAIAGQLTLELDNYINVADLFVSEAA
ncbi:hypothetical protein ABZ682_30130 [Streptomyces griseoviridis]|uniref:hypothetical protein n=1 Tax=Streptomyces TaxID=1883 RepID=UPI002473DC4A|nr:hypothetical protein [Streptomyces sp. MAA16]